MRYAAPALPPNTRQLAAIGALESDFPAPNVVGWRGTPGGEVVGSIYADVDHDADGKPCGTFTICTTGVVRWTRRPEKRDDG